MFARVLFENYIFYFENDIYYFFQYYNFVSLLARKRCGGGSR